MTDQHELTQEQIEQERAAFDEWWCDAPFHDRGVTVAWRSWLARASSQAERVRELERDREEAKRLVDDMGASIRVTSTKEKAK